MPQLGESIAEATVVDIKVKTGDEVVTVPGIAVAPGWEDAVRAWKDAEE